MGKKPKPEMPAASFYQFDLLLIPRHLQTRLMIQTRKRTYRRTDTPTFI